MEGTFQIHIEKLPESLCLAISDEWERILVPIKNCTMIEQVKRAIQQIEKLPESKQIEIAKLIQDELNWDATILQSQDQLATLAKEALKEYKDGKTSDESW